MGEVVAFIAQYIWIPAITAIGWIIKVIREEWKENSKKEEDRNHQIASLQNKVALLERDYIPEHKVRGLIKECLEPLSKDFSEMNDNVKKIAEIVVQLKIDQAVLNSTRGSSGKHE
jgi:hypothetical protein